MAEGHPRWAEDRGRGLTVAARKLDTLAREVISGKKPQRAVDLLAEHDQFLRKEIEALDRAIAKGGDPTGDLATARQNLELAADAAGSEGMMDTRMALLGMEELIPGALWKGTPEQIKEAIAHAKKGKQAVEVSRDGNRWRVKVGEREIQVQEVASATKTVDVERVVLGGGDGELRVAAKLVPPEPGSLDVVVHGSIDDFMVTVNGKDIPVDHRALAAYIKKSGIPYKRIRLLSCKAGMHPKGVAQHLANKLGVPVVAPMDKLYIHPDGKMTVGPAESRDLGPAGWHEFNPTKSSLRYEKAPAAPVESTPAMAPALPAVETTTPPAGAKALGGAKPKGEQLTKWPPPAGERPPARHTKKVADWRWRNYVENERAAGKPMSEIYNQEAYTNRGYATAADEGKRPGRSGGPEQVAAKKKLAKQGGWTLSENTTLGDRPHPARKGDTKRNDVDGYRSNQLGGTDYLEVDHLGARGLPSAVYRRKLVAEIRNLKPNDRVFIYDSADPGRFIVYTAKDIPNVERVVDNRTDANPPAPPVKSSAGTTSSAPSLATPTKKQGPRR